ncbi:MAG TPA: STN domain-containing protein, partial [Puia sp.]|nr:STN domain-containing protein [Puia sp.]
MRNFSSTRRMLSCLLGIQLLCFAAAHSQSTYAFSGKDVRVVQKGQENNFREENAQKPTLFDVLKGLNKTKGIYFLFSEQSLGAKLVNPPEENNASVEKTLDHVLKNTGLKFKKINEKTFVILTKEAGNSAMDPKPVDFAQNLSLASTNDMTI